MIFLRGKPPCIPIPVRHILANGVKIRSMVRVSMHGQMETGIKAVIGTVKGKVLVQ